MWERLRMEFDVGCLLILELYHGAAVFSYSNRIIYSSLGGDSLRAYRDNFNTIDK